MKRIIIIGATSGIGKGLAELYAQTNVLIGLVGRREEKLKELYSTNPIKYRYRCCDISDIEASDSCLEALINELGGMDMIIISSGTGELNPSLEYKLEEPSILTNVLGFTYLVDKTFKYFERQKHGHLVAISSVGGLRGSGVAPAYSASKSYQMNYLEGMRQKATKANLPIFVTDIRPGFVDTDMAKGEGLFWVTSVEKSCKQIFCAIKHKRKIVYISKRWRFISVILKLVPSSLYCRL